MLGRNPVELTATNQTYDQPCQILAIVWHGATTVGDVVTLQYQGGSKIGKIWQARAASAVTYIHIQFGEAGLMAPNGFIVSQLNSGSVLVYLRED
jgi:hypothetical protein